MTTERCKKRKHTPIVSEKQRGFMGAEYARKKRGLKGKTGMSKAELRRHLEEAKGKNLPEKSRKYNRLRAQARKAIREKFHYDVGK